jgi:ribosome biogenesis GTPase
VVAVGDHVRISVNGTEQGVVEAVLPRHSALVRPEAFRGYKTQVIAANVDQLLIVVAWRNPHIWLELIDRYLIAARRNDLAPVICVNKVDLADDIAVCRAELSPYEKLGYRLIFTSTVTGYGIKELQVMLRGRTTVLAGVSGVGKSSLLTAVQPGSTVRIGEVNDESGEGRHTTTQARWHTLDMGGAVVDTPGIREFGLSGLQAAELAHFYPEMDELSHHCRFGDCTHIHEPGCEIIAAVEQGQVAAVRYRNYTKIFDALLPA